MNPGADDWLIHHFSLANPKGRRQGDLPSLLRRLAKEIEGLDDAVVQDLVMHEELTNRGPWYSFTVYYSRPDDPA
jgi:hypothetical protein